MAKKPKSTGETAEEIRERLLERPLIEEPDYDLGLSLGSTLLNMACTGHPDVGLVPGSMFTFSGGSNSGKTWISLVAFAEAAQNPHYDDYKFFYDAVELGAQMDAEMHFGSKMAARLEPPCYLDELPWHSETVEDFYYNLDIALDKGPCIYALDSMDGLTSEADEKKFDEDRKAHIKGTKPEKGSYGMDRAKKNSQFVRRIIPKLARTKSILIVIRQARDDIGAPFPSETTGGGRALTFYAQVDVWARAKRKLKSTEIRKKERHIGNLCEFHIKRSRYTGHEAKVEVPIYFNTGIDEVGSCVDYLISEQHWKQEGQRIKAPEFGQDCTRTKLIRIIESENREAELSKLVGKVWREIEEESGVDRKKRYT